MILPFTVAIRFGACDFGASVLDKILVSTDFESKGASMGISEISISNPVSKIDGVERTSLSYASIKDARNRRERSITTERIEKGNTLLGIYEVLSNPASGGMGSVWRIHHKNWNIDLAMKRPHPEFFAEGSDVKKELFVRECENWISLGLHPNIVSCYYVREIGGVPTVFSEWMDGGSLEERIQDGSLYEGAEEEIQERLLAVSIAFARGLRYAHEKGRIIHQDVKPSNLMLTKDGEAKVSDFGLAAVQITGKKSVRGGAMQNIDSSAPVMVPTKGFSEAYCSPEQVEKRMLTIRTDLYSWAVSILEMYLKGKPWARRGEITGPEAGRRCREFFGMEKVRIPERMKDLLKCCLYAEEAERPDGFSVVEEELLEIYREERGKDFPIPEPHTVEYTADSLNNVALSFLDLGMPDDARNKWQNALKIAPGHPASVYNMGLLDWRSARIDDLEAMSRCRQSGGNSDKAVTKRLLKQICQERADITEQPLSDSVTKESQGRNWNQIRMAPLSERYIDQGVEIKCKSPDESRYLCFDMLAQEILLVDSDHKILASIWNPHHMNLYGACFTQDGKTIYAGGNGYLAFLDADTLRWEEIGFDDSVGTIFRSESGRFMIARSTYCDRIIDARTRRILLTLDSRNQHLVEWSEQGDLVRAVFAGRHGGERVIENRFPGPEAPWELCMIRNILEAASDKDRVNLLEEQLREALDRNEIGQAIAILHEAEELGGSFRFLEYRREIYERRTPKALLGINELTNIPLPEGVIPHSAAFHPLNGKLAVSHAGRNGAVISILDRGMHSCRSVSIGIKEPPRIFFSYSGKLLVCTFSGNYTQIRDAEDGKVLMRVGETDPQARSIVAVDPEDRLLLTIKRKETIFWSIPEGKVRKRTTSRLSNIYDACFLKDGRTVFGMENGKIRITNAYHWLGKASVQLFDYDEPVYKVVPSRDGTRLFANYDEFISIVDMRKPEQCGELTRPFDADVISWTDCQMAVSADGLLLAATKKNNIYIWYLPERKVIQSFRIRKQDIIREIHFSAEGSLLCVCSDLGFHMWVLEREM